MYLLQRCTDCCYLLHRKTVHYSFGRFCILCMFYLFYVYSDSTAEVCVQSFISHLLLQAVWTLLFLTRDVMHIILSFVYFFKLLKKHHILHCRFFAYLKQIFVVSSNWFAFIYFSIQSRKQLVSFFIFSFCRNSCFNFSHFVCLFYFNQVFNSIKNICKFFESKKRKKSGKNILSSKALILGVNKNIALLKEQSRNIAQINC